MPLTIFMLYIISYRLQEVKSQPQNMLMDSLFTDAWTACFNKILCRQGFIIAKSTRLQGILLLVYTQMKHVTHLRDIEAQYTKTGLGGMWVSWNCLFLSVSSLFNCKDLIFKPERCSILHVTGLSP